MAVVLIVAWVLLFAPLAVLPFLPKVDGEHAPVAGRAPERQVISLGEGRQERAA
jgi:hypothetical protein